MPVASLSYLLFSIVILISLITITLVIGLVKGWYKVGKFLAFSIPLSILILSYFWSQGINNFVNSYISPTKGYECNSLGEIIEIPLPKRTVFIGKSENCDLSYRTYIDEEKFVSFYNDQLSKLKDSNLIKNYSYEQSQFIAQTTDINILIKFSYLEKDYTMIYFQQQ